MSNNSHDKKGLPALLDSLHQEHWHLTKLLALLIVVCMTGLGSLSVAQHLLPEGPLVPITPTPNYDDGRCDADPAQMTYVPLVSSPPANQKLSNSTKQLHTALTKLAINSHLKAQQSELKPIQIPAVGPLPSDWTLDGFNDIDASYVEACAATFVKVYHTYDASNPQTFENAAFMLSAHAKKLFYLGGMEDTDNIHLRMLPNWQRTAQQQQQIEQATVDRPVIHDISSVGSQFIVTVKVGYNLQKQTNGIVTSFIYNDTVILQNTTPSAKLPNEKTGWQVVDWKDQDA